MEKILSSEFSSVAIAEEAVRVRLLLAQLRRQVVDSVDGNVLFLGQLSESMQYYLTAFRLSAGVSPYWPGDVPSQPPGAHDRQLLGVAPLEKPLALPSTVLYLETILSATKLRFPRFFLRQNP